MKKYIVYTRSFPGCKSDVPTVVEVEGEIVSPLEDSSVMFLPSNEFKFRIDKPVSLHESHEVKFPDGSKKKVMIPSVYHSFAIFNTATEARQNAEQMIKQDFDFELRKGRISSYSDEELKVKYDLIQEIML